MIAQDRYNRIIETVERIVRSRSKTEWEAPLDANQVGDEAFAAGESIYFDKRSRNEIFKFMTGKTFPQYLSERLAMYAYETLLQQEAYSEEELLNILGFSSGSALYKKFKEVFDLSPREAFEKRDRSLYKKPDYWDSLSNEKQQIFIKQVEVVRQEVKLDRRPYYVLAAVVVLCIGLFFMLRSYLRNDVWTGDYTAIRITTTEDGWPKAQWQDRSTYSIDPHQNLLTVAGYDAGQKMYRASFENGIIKWRDEAHLYEGTWYSDGSILCYLDGMDSEQLRLIRRDELNSWLESWKGYYEIYQEDEGYYVPSGTNINIAPEEFLIVMSTLGDEDGNLENGTTSVGHIFYIGPEHLLFYFYDDPERLLQCDLTGKDTFELVNAVDQEVLAKGFRVLQ